MRANSNVFDIVKIVMDRENPQARFFSYRIIGQDTYDVLTLIKKGMRTT